MTLPIDYKYTLVIPTRNRQRYCLEAIQSAVDAERPDLQIIVADNSDDAEALPAALEAAGLRERVELLESAREVLSMRRNWERTVPRIRGEWVTYIGDDDGVLKQGYALLDLLIARFAFNAFTWRPLYYKWPCFPDVDRNTIDFAAFGLQARITATAEILRISREWDTREKWPISGPAVYHGATHVSVIEAALARFGEYFLNYVVDYASGVTNCLFVDHVMHVSWPATIMGACGASNTAGLTASGAAKAKIDQFRAENAGVDALYPEFQDTRLHAPWVMKGYAQLFERLGVAFHMTPEKFLTSCAAELRCVRDAEVFESERRRLASFEARRGLRCGVARLERPELQPDYGFSPTLGGLSMNAERFGWRGISDVARNYEAFARNERSTEAMVEQLAAQVTAPFLRGAAAA